MKKLSIALSFAILVLCLVPQLVLKYYFGLEINAGMGILVGIVVGLSASVGYIYAKLEDIYEE